MNTRRLFLGLSLLALPTASPAAWVVFDPTLQAQMIISTAQEVAKFVEMIDNQLDQLKALEEEVRTLHHYVDLFGDPAAVVPASQAPLHRDLERPEVGAVLTDLLARVDPAAAMLHDGGGVFAGVGQEFRTPGGATVSRQEALYRPVAALQQTTDNFQAVTADTAARRATLKGEISRTVAALAGARTDAEVQKLTGILVGLEAALQGIEAELAQAAASALVQDVATRTDERRQSDARKEQQAAEFTEALENYGRTFQLLSAPVAFPVR